MVKKMMRFAKVTLACIAVFGAGAVGAQSVSEASAAQSAAWTQPGSRNALGQKGAAFFSGGTGNFVNSASMRANGVVAQQKTGNTQPDLSTQFNYLFGGVPDAEVALEGGQRLFNACEPHNCVGKRTFLVTDSAGDKVESAGFLSVSCAVGMNFQKSEKDLPASCDTTPTLTIFYENRQARQPALSLAIIKWARNRVIATHQSDRIRVVEKFVH